MIRNAYAKNENPMTHKNHDPADGITKMVADRFGFPEGELEKLSALTRRHVLAKGERFIAAGNIPTRLAYVCKGLFRYVYLDPRGNEYTKGFFPEGDFIVSYSAMVSQLPSYFSIEALEDSVVDELDYANWLTLLNGHSCWTTLLVTFLQKGYIKKEKREREFLLLNARERYQSFLQEYPGLESRLRQHMVASYLGITPVALSRIRSQTKHISINIG